MKKMKDKVRRKRIRWFKVLKALGKAELEHDFICRLEILYKGSHLSINRCAYYTLKNYYHTTTIDELYDVIFNKELLYVPASTSLKEMDSQL